MNPQKSGHYFCDRCDDLAFGRFCQTCREPARWVPHPIKKIPVETAADYFRQMRAAVHGTPVARN
jgi:hypothetical protein